MKRRDGRPLIRPISHLWVILSTFICFVFAWITSFLLYLCICSCIPPLINGCCNRSWIYSVKRRDFWFRSISNKLLFGGGRFLIPILFFLVPIDNLAHTIFANNFRGLFFSKELKSFNQADFVRSELSLLSKSTTSVLIHQWSITYTGQMTNLFEGILDTNQLGGILFYFQVISHKWSGAYFFLSNISEV